MSLRSSLRVRARALQPGAQRALEDPLISALVHSLHYSRGDATRRRRFRQKFIERNRTFAPRRDSTGQRVRSLPLAMAGFSLA